MEQTQVVSSPTVMEDPFNGQTPTLREFNDFRVTGEVPARFKAEPAESAPADAPEQTATPETQPESEPEENQEQPHKGSSAEKRIKQLLARTKELESQLAAKQDVKPAPSAAPEQPLTRPKPTLGDKKDDGTAKYADYESFVEDLADWKAEQRIESVRRQQIQQEQAKKVQQNVDSAREKYGDEFDSVIEPTAGEIMGDKSIPLEVKRMLAQSDVLPELVYAMGTDDKTKKEFIVAAKADPLKALRYIATLEAGIHAELDKPEPEEKAPEPKKTSAPKPPAPVSGSSSRAFDVSDTSLPAEEWARQRNAQLARRH